MMAAQTTSLTNYIYLYISPHVFAEIDKACLSMPHSVRVFSLLKGTSSAETPACSFEDVARCPGELSGRIDAALTY